MAFLNYTPFSFLFVLVYACLFFLLPAVTSFYIFWVLMELLMLALIGVAYSVVIACYGSLMCYFLIQTYASFSIFCFFILDLETCFFFAVLLKLSMFPFHFWFPLVCYRFPNLLLWVVSTVHKFPMYLAFYVCGLSVPSLLALSSVILTMLTLGVGMWLLSEFRLFLVFSTSFNGAWLILAYVTGFGVFMLYFWVYALSFSAVLFALDLKSRPSTSSTTAEYSRVVYLFSAVLVLSGLPPSPLFFIKCATVSSALVSGIPLWLLICSLCLTVFVVVSYFLFVFNYVVYKYASNA